jgi:rubredoxin
MTDEPDDAYEEENEADSEWGLSIEEMLDQGEPEEEPDFTCGRCGGSGGGPEHWRCPSCLGSGEDKFARRAYLEDRRGDEEYDRLKDEGRLS